MRLFYLQNESGSRIPLNNETGIFLTEPEGLGLEFGDSFADISEGFFRMTSKKYSQKEISGKLNFTKDPYFLYQQFINWCAKAKSIYFIYKPLDTEYHIHVEISSIEKTELVKAGYLETRLRMKYLSPWYIPAPAAITTIGSDVTPFRWDTSYFGSGDVLIGSYAEAFSAEISAIGHLPAAILVTFTGTADHPVFILTGTKTGTIYGCCDIDKIFSVPTTIELSTMYEDSYIKSIDLLGQETDLLPYIDLTYDPFFKVPLDEVCILTLTDNEALDGELTGKTFFYYRSV